MIICYILVGMFVVPGIVLGIYEAVRQVFGYSNAWLFGEIDNSSRLGRFPTILTQISILNIFITLIFFMTEWYYVSIGVVSLVSGVLVSLRECIADNTRRNIAIIVSDVIFWGTIGVILVFNHIFTGEIVEIAEMIQGSVAGGILGGATALSEILIMRAFNKHYPEKNCHIFPFWTNGWFFFLLALCIIEFSYVSCIITLILGVINGLFSLLTIWCIPVTVLYVRKPVSCLLSRSFIVLRYKTNLCQHCFRYTHPLKATYRVGQRYCEHCQQEVEHSDPSVKLIVVFGELSLKLPDKDILFVNPDFETKRQPVDVSEVYIEPCTCNRILLERFITYLHSYPPEHGISSINLFYQGDLHQLGANLENVLRNNFAQIRPIPRELQGNERRTGLPHSRLLQADYNVRPPHLRKLFLRPPNNRNGVECESIERNGEL